MATSAAQTVDQYLAELPADRRAQLAKVRSVVKKRLPRGFVETMQYGMISWVVPPARYPSTYNNQPLAIASLASQKNHVALYLMGVYGNADVQARFEAGFRAAGKKLDMGKSCLRWTRLEDIPLDVVGDALASVGVEDFIAMYERSRPAKKPAAKKPAAKKPAAKKPAAKKPAAKKSAAKKPAGR